MERTKLSDWCKWLEKNFSPEIAIPKLPVIIRLDGVGFSKYTSKMGKPFDAGLSELMVKTTEFAVKETNAVIGYTQSDEITLILYSDDVKSMIYHDGKKSKILSKLTSAVTNFFNRERGKYVFAAYDAEFDCRMYQTPTLHDATLQLLWRENDATRNSKSMLARAHFSHGEVENKSGNELVQMVYDKTGIDWNGLEPRYKRGTYIRKELRTSVLTNEELEALPPMHNARKNPQLAIERNHIGAIEMPIFSKV